jgi:U3 small nucleolar RNA-associated protein 25
MCSLVAVVLELTNQSPKKRDSDFLSSIELVIMDQTDAILMQNWEHLQFVFEHLNLQPKESHGCDYSRVRNWYLDGNAAYLRQTVVLSAYATPELITLFNHNMQNIGGRLKYQPSYDGAVERVNLQVKQTFSRFSSSSPVDDPDARFKYFTTAIVPALSRYSKPSEGGQGTLIILPGYFEFVRVRNYFASSAATENISFGAISEYTEPAEMRRARAHFVSGKHSVLLYTSRAHHFKRYNLQGVKRIIIYAPPDNPIFYEEYLAGFLGRTVAEGKIDSGLPTARILFSKFDMLRLERIVGSERVKKMIRDNAGDTFDFV